MDTTAIVVVIFCAAFIIGGPIVGHLASKAGEKSEKEETNNSKNK